MAGKLKNTLFFFLPLLTLSCSEKFQVPIDDQTESIAGHEHNPAMRHALLLQSTKLAAPLVTIPPDFAASATPVTTSPALPSDSIPAATFTPGSPEQLWCVAKAGASESSLQPALDYACGPGGADCSDIQQGQGCFYPNTIHTHASYAFNNYYQKNPLPSSCDFGGTAMLVSLNPSSGTCIYPSSSRITTSSAWNRNNPTSSTPVFASALPVYSVSGATSDDLNFLSTFMMLIASVLMGILLAVV